MQDESKEMCSREFHFIGIHFNLNSSGFETCQTWCLFLRLSKHQCFYFRILCFPTHSFLPKNPKPLPSSLYAPKAQFSQLFLSSQLSDSNSCKSCLALYALCLLCIHEYSSFSNSDIRSQVGHANIMVKHCRSSR